MEITLAIFTKQVNKNTIAIRIFRTETSIPISVFKATTDNKANQATRARYLYPDPVEGAAAGGVLVRSSFIMV